MLLQSITKTPSSFVLSRVKINWISTTTPPKTVSSEVTSSFKSWFLTQSNPLLDRIYQILNAHVDDDASTRRAADIALSNLGLPLTEPFVLEVLHFGTDVLSCLKFFDWAGRQPNYYHSRATFNAIFKIISRAKLMSLMLEFLQNYTKHRYVHRVRFYDTLIMGYAVAGRPHIALQLFGKMRFQGLDLDDFAYHVLLNAMIEESCFDVVDVLLHQIKMRGFESDLTYSIWVKSLCRQRKLDEAEAYVRGLGRVSGHAFSTLIDALCKNSMFEKASRLVEEFRELGIVDSIEMAYSVFIRDLVHAGKLDGALEFYKSKKLSEGYLPDVFRYNVLIWRLLRENRLVEVCDLLMEMKEFNISADKVTMNAALCFFCKAGMVDVALELYNSRSEFGLSPNGMAYNYLINTLCGDGGVDEAYRVLKHSINQGFFPKRRTFSILADSLCREGKLDKMKELVIVALERNVMPSDSICDKFIAALCRRNVEDGYLIHGELSRVNKVVSPSTYFHLIHGFNKSNRPDISARLLIEMQEKGHTPNRKLFRAVLVRVCNMDDGEKQFFRLLELHLTRNEQKVMVYNYFIDGAGHGKKPELAKQVYEMMGKSGMGFNVYSDILMLQSYLKSGRISEAMNFFEDVRTRRTIGKKLYNSIIVGLSKAEREDFAMEIFREVRETDLIPSLECYEELVKVLCSKKNYETAVDLIGDLEKHMSSFVPTFIGNTLLMHALKSDEIFDTWVSLRDNRDNVSLPYMLLGHLMGGFCGRIEFRHRIEEVEEAISQCFPLDLFTYNMLMRRLSMVDVDHACAFFHRICQKGFEPNRWSYDIIIQGFLRQGRTAEAEQWLEEMFNKGFDPTERIQLLM